MKETMQQTAAVTRLELTRTWAMPATRVALITFLALTAVGQYLYWRALPPRPVDDRLLAHAFLLAAMIGLRIGISGDRTLGSESLMVGNLIRPAAYFFGKLGAFLSALLALTAIAFAYASVISAGDWRHALWYSTAIALVICLFTPLILAIELLMQTRYPGPAALVIFSVAMIIAGITTGVEPVVNILALDMTGLDFHTLPPLAARSVAALILTAIMYGLWRPRARG